MRCNRRDLTQSGHRLIIAWKHRLLEQSPPVTHFIRWYDDSLSPEMCTDILSRFDKDPRRMVGKVSGNQGPETDLKAKPTTELIIPNDGWSARCSARQQCLAGGRGKYVAAV